MRSRIALRLTVATLMILGGQVSTLAHEENELNVSAPLAAVPCFNHGDINLEGDDLRVTAGQAVTCKSSGGEIRLKNITVESGATFRVSASQHSHEPLPEHLTKWADTSCTSGIMGSGDCNVCAHNVPEQFDALFGDRARTSERFWKLRQQVTYQPSNLRPRDAFSINSANRLFQHVQGFVKTGSGTYAGTYSHKDEGSIFIIHYDASVDRHDLIGLHRAREGHPSGMAVLGKHVIFEDTANDSEGRDVRVIKHQDFQSPTNDRLFVRNWVLGVRTVSFNAGGGLGMVKLASGGYLLISTHPGGPTLRDLELGDISVNVGPRSTDFFYVEGKPDDSGFGLATFGSDIYDSGYLEMDATFLGRWTQDSFGENAKQAKYQYSENLSAISECDTGDIYVIHTSSVEPEALLQNSVDGFWRLSKVVWKPTGPELEILSVYTEDQSFGGCLHRAAATAWVTPNNQLELYCSEYGVDDRREDDMHFKIRAIDNEADL